ncbi:MAG: hypothetical protein M1561_02605 [Gammaproteobacteria bacterium]|nr:hypothetical protein [Gammaproteobacteria bacterium]
MSDAIVPKRAPDTADKRACNKFWQFIKGIGELALFGIAAFAGYKIFSHASSEDDSSSISTDADSTAVVTTDAEMKRSVSVNTVTTVPDYTVIDFDTANAKNTPKKFNTDTLVFPSFQLQGSDSNSVLPLQVGTINLGECATVLVTDKNVSAVTSDSDPAEFSYRFYPQYCRVQLVSNPGASVETVSQTALATNQVQVTQDCTLEEAHTPTLQVIVNYQGTESPRQNITINFIRMPFLEINNNLTIGENGVVDLRSAQIVVGNAEAPTLGIKVNIQNGEIVSSATQQSIQVFSPQALAQGGVELRSTNKRAPTVTLSAFNAYTESKPQQVPVIYYPAPYFTFNNLRALQGRSFFVTNDTFNVVSVANPFPIILRFPNLKHGMFSHVTAPSTPMTEVPYSAVLQGEKILFTHDGTPKKPSGTVFLVAGPATGATTAINGHFDASPYMARASGSMEKGTTKKLYEDSLWFEDPDNDPKEITIIISDVQHGTISPLIFKQNVLLSSGISATQEGEGDLQFNVSATDGSITTDPITMRVTLLPTNESIISGSLETTFIVAGVLGVLGVGVWKIKNSCITNRNKSLFSAGTFHNLVCRALFFNRLKFSGCCKFTSDGLTKEFIDAVTVLVDEVVAVNNFDTAKMPSEKQELLAIKIANKTIEAISPQYSNWGKCARFFQSPCVPDVKPDVITTNAKKIAKAINDDLVRDAKKRAESIELVVDDGQDHKSTFIHNPLAAGSTSVPSITTQSQANSSSSNSVMTISDIVRQQETLKS